MDVQSVPKPKTKSGLVGKGRLELPRLAAHDPKSCSSTNSDTPPEPKSIANITNYDSCTPKFGDPPRTRTENLLIKSQLLCQIELAGQYTWLSVRTLALADCAVNVTP